MYGCSSSSIPQPKRSYGQISKFTVSLRRVSCLRGALHLLLTDCKGIARAITTAYLVPLLLLLASAQLSTLARIRYLSDVKSSLSDKSKSTQQSPSEDETEAESSTVAQTRPTSGGWLKFFSVESMGLAEYVDANTPGPLSSVTNLFAGLRMNSDSKPDAREKEVVSETEEERANAERLYLTYSWWLLHQGWQGVANRVDRAVDLVFAR